MKVNDYFQKYNELLNRCSAKPSQ
jgi:hypothetical protein